MKRETVVPAVAVALYVAFWLAVLFGYLRVDSADDLYDLLRVIAVMVPAVVLGVAVGRWRAVLAGLVFLVAATLPDRTAIEGTGVDVTETGIYGVSLGEALELLALSTPWVVLGVIARRFAASRTAGGGQPTDERMKSTIS